MPSRIDCAREMPRALLTDAETRAVKGDPEMSDSNIRTHLSNIRQKIDDLEEDFELIREHRPDLYDMAHDAVCIDPRDRQIEELERRLSELEEELRESRSE